MNQYRQIEYDNSISVIKKLAEKIVKRGEWDESIRSLNCFKAQGLSFLMPSQELLELVEGVMKIQTTIWIFGSSVFSNYSTEFARQGLIPPDSASDIIKYFDYDALVICGQIANEIISKIDDTTLSFKEIVQVLDKRYKEKSRIFYPCT